MPHAITSFVYKTRFAKDLKSLPVDIQREVKLALDDLQKNPIPTTRRLHPLTGFKNPKVYTIDVLSNHPYKISFEIDGKVAILRRVATHKSIDHCP